MKVRARARHSVENGILEPGDVFDLPDYLAEIRIASGLVEAVGEPRSIVVEEAVAPTVGVEQAVSRKRKDR